MKTILNELETIVKIEPERFEDEIFKDDPKQIQKCIVYVYDVLKPVVELYPLNARTISRWTKHKPKNHELEEFLSKTSQENEEKIIRFSCDLCLNWFPAKSSLKKHMYCHQSAVENSSDIKDGKTCPFCFKKVEANKLKTHINNHKQLLNKRTCPHCGLKINNTHLKRHILSHEQFRCRKCKLVLDSQSELKAHLSTDHYGGKGHECFCGKIYKTLVSLKCHEFNIHFNRKTSCESCGEEFERYLQKTAHWRVVHLKKLGNYGEWKRKNGNITMKLSSGGPYICDICGHVCQQRVTLSAHFKQRHSPKKAFSCDLCGKIYFHKQYLKTHMESVHMSNKFDCKVCGKRFARTVYLRQHLKTHNKKTKCNICDKLVTDAKSHFITVHSKEAKSPCAICGVIFYNNYMKHHIKARHLEKPKPFKCDKCDQAFLHKGKFIEHKTEKHGFKPLRCHCGYSNPFKFKKHQKVHAGQSSTYKCPVCGMENKTLSRLRTHWKHNHAKSLGHRVFLCTMNRSCSA